MGYHQSGKAMLTVEKDGDDFFVDGFVLSGLETDGQFQWFNDDLSLLAYCDWLPNQCHRMVNGDIIIFKIQFEQNYYPGDGYSSDDDTDFIINKAVKLYHRRGDKLSRRQLKKYYQPKVK